MAGKKGKTRHKGKMPGSVSYSVWHRRPAEWLKLAAVWTAVSAGFGFLFYRAWQGAVLLLPFFVLFEKADRRRQIKKRQDRLASGFREALHAMAAAMQAGMALEQAVVRARKQLKGLYPESEPVMEELKVIESGIGINVPVEQLFADLGARSGVRDIAEFAEVVVTAKRAGGNLVRVMEHTVASMDARSDMEREIAAEIAGRKLEADCMMFLIPGILIYMNLGMADMTAKLYHNLTGQLLMTGLLAGYGLSMLWIRKIMDISV